MLDLLEPCPSCGSTNVKRNGNPGNGRKSMKCKDCGRQYRVKLGMFKVCKGKIEVNKLGSMTDEYGISWGAYRGSIEKKVKEGYVFNGDFFLLLGNNLFDDSDNLIIFDKCRVLHAFLYINDFKYNKILKDYGNFNR